MAPSPIDSVIHRWPAGRTIARQLGPPGTAGHVGTVAAITANRMAHIYGTRPGPIWLLASRHFRMARHPIPAYQAPAGSYGVHLSGPRIRPLRAAGRAHAGHRTRPSGPSVASS